MKQTHQRLSAHPNLYVIYHLSLHYLRDELLNFEMVIIKVFRSKQFFSGIKIIYQCGYCALALYNLHKSDQITAKIGEGDPKVICLQINIL